MKFLASSYCTFQDIALYKIAMSTMLNVRMISKVVLVYVQGCSTANIKAVRESLWSCSVNKLSHIPKLQSVSAVYKNQ